MLSSKFKKLIPTLNRVLVKKIEGEPQKTKSGIIISSKPKETNVGTIVAVGPGGRPALVLDRKRRRPPDPLVCARLLLRPEHVWLVRVAFSRLFGLCSGMHCTMLRPCISIPADPHKKHPTSLWPLTLQQLPPGSAPPSATLSLPSFGHHPPGLYFLV